jgi:hypothetical protein
MASPVMSFEEFMQKVWSETQSNIEKANESVEGNLPQILEMKGLVRQRSLLINPREAQTHMRELIQHQHKADRFLDVVSALRGQVEITEVGPGHRDDKRDWFLKGRDPRTGENVPDMRVLVGSPQRQGDDIRNEVTQAAFYKALNLHVYREKASLN